MNGHEFGQSDCFWVGCPAIYLQSCHWGPKQENCIFQASMNHVVKACFKTTKIASKDITGNSSVCLSVRSLWVCFLFCFCFPFQKVSVQPRMSSDPWPPSSLIPLSSVFSHEFSHPAECLFLYFLLWTLSHYFSPAGARRPELICQQAVRGTRSDLLNAAAAGREALFLLLQWGQEKKKKGSGRDRHTNWNLSKELQENRSKWPISL